MNSKSVLTKILTLLSLTDEVNFTDAKTEDGTILQSPTFDLGETVDVVSEDGTKTPATDGEYQISLRDSEGNETLIYIGIMDGKITERENVEMESDATPVAPDVNPAPSANEPVAMANEFPAAPKGATKEEAHPLPNTTDEDPRNMIADDSEETEKDPLISLGYRISELEKAFKTMMEEANPPMEEAAAVDEVAMAEVEEEELPKLDGAPLDTAVKFSADTIHKPNYGRKVGDSQSSFLSKLYN